MTLRRSAATSQFELELKSTHESDIGQHMIEVKVYLDADPMIFARKTLTVTVNPCHPTQYIVQTMLGVTDYQVGSGSLTTAPYQFSLMPAECDYSSSAIVTITGAPNYLLHDEAQRRFVIDSASARTEVFEVKVTSTI